MVFDLDLIKKIYSEMPGRIEAARKLLGKPLTFSEKILYSHLSGPLPPKPHNRGKDYVDFAPDRGSYAGCHSADGFIAVHDLWP